MNISTDRPIEYYATVNSVTVNNNFIEKTRSILSTLPVIIFLFSCSKIAPPAPERSMLDSTLVTPVSQLHVPVFIPVQDLEDMANEKLDGKIIEANLPISKGDDSLFLNVSRFRPLD